MLSEQLLHTLLIVCPLSGRTGAAVAGGGGLITLPPIAGRPSPCRLCHQQLERGGQHARLSWCLAGAAQHDQCPSVTSII